MIGVYKHDEAAGADVLPLFDLHADDLIVLLQHNLGSEIQFFVS